MRRGRGEADHVEQRSAADGNDIRMAVDVMPVDMRMNFGDEKIGILGALAAFNHKRLANEFECLGVGCEIRFNLARDVRLGLREGFIQNEKDFFDGAGFVTGHGLFQNEIGGGKDVIGKEYAQIVIDLYGFSHYGHGIKVEWVGPDFEF
jgi:hypothetical protein